LIITASAACAIALLSSRSRWPALTVLTCCWCLLHFHNRLQDRLDPALAGVVRTVSGVVSSIPQDHGDYTRFQFEPAPDSAKEDLPATILVHWYRERPEIRAGEHWELEMTLKPPWGRVNFQGADRERWLFANDLGALGTVRNGRPLREGHGNSWWGNLWRIQAVREAVLDQIETRVRDERERGVIQALATADRSGMSAADRRLLTVTGTSHLLAISGLHIGLAAAGGLWLGRVVLFLLPLAMKGAHSFLYPVVTALGCALAYAALAGFGAATVRAFLMLLIALAAHLASRAIHPLNAWALALAVMMLFDPFAAMSAGFWFSFLAVAALLIAFVPRNERRCWWKTLLLAQAAVMLMLMPLGAAWFNLVSPAGFLANLVAIPWVSLLVVPLVLAGIASLAISGMIAGVLWSAAGLAASGLFRFLEWIDLAQGQVAAVPAPSLLQMLLAMLGGCLLLLPRGLALRWGGLFLIAPLFFPPGARSGPGTLEVEILDAGQGGAVLVSSAGKSLLYDTGPGDGGERTLVPGVIAPALARLGGRAPDIVVVSHGDLDHAGGLAALRGLYPEAAYYASLRNPEVGVSDCKPPLGWRWQETAIQVLHPNEGLPYLGNDSSCVLSIRSGRHGVLLTGDITATIENRLVEQGIGPHNILLVPHHGSTTSSSEDFIKAVKPGIAVATAGLGNRFDFPRASVRSRYELEGTRFWSTGECGALRLLLDRDGSMVASSARRVNKRIWRWPVEENCP